MSPVCVDFVSDSVRVLYVFYLTQEIKSLWFELKYLLYSCQNSLRDRSKASRSNDFFRCDLFESSRLIDVF